MCKYLLFLLELFHQLKKLILIIVFNSSQQRHILYVLQAFKNSNSRNEKAIESIDLQKFYIDLCKYFFQFLAKTLCFLSVFHILTCMLFKFVSKETVTFSEILFFFFKKVL